MRRERSYVIFHYLPYLYFPVSEHPVASVEDPSVEILSASQAKLIKEGKQALKTLIVLVINMYSVINEFIATYIFILTQC